MTSGGGQRRDRRGRGRRRDRGHRGQRRRSLGARRDAAPDGGRIPVNHRATGETCDQVRSTSTSFPPEDAGAPIAACHTDANCTAGANGRCRSTRFSWICTYEHVSPIPIAR